MVVSTSQMLKNGCVYIHTCMHTYICIYVMESHSIELAFLYCPPLLPPSGCASEISPPFHSYCSRELSHDDDTSGHISSSWSIHRCHYRKPVHSPIIRVYSSWTIGALHRNQDNPGSNHLVAPPSPHLLALVPCRPRARAMAMMRR